MEGLGSFSGFRGFFFGALRKPLLLGVQSSFGFRTVKDSGYRGAQGFRDMHTVLGALGFRAFGAFRGFRVWGFRCWISGSGVEGIKVCDLRLDCWACHGVMGLF